MLIWKDDDIYFPLQAIFADFKFYFHVIFGAFLFYVLYCVSIYDWVFMFCVGSFCFQSGSLTPIYISLCHTLNNLFITKFRRKENLLNLLVIL